MLLNVDRAVAEGYRPPSSWYAVHVRSNFEKRVAEQLATKGLESYVPAMAEVHEWKDRNKLIEAPLFPGYVFTRFYDTAPSRLTVLRTFGTVRILGGSNGIEAIPDMEIESIQHLLQAHRQANVALMTHPLMREGASGRITRGPLKDLEGRLVRMKNQFRLVLSVQLLSRSVSVEVDMRDVEMVRPSEYQVGPVKPQ